jgi:hypothetical protein
MLDLDAISPDTREILLRFQWAKTRYDGLELMFGDSVPSGEYGLAITREYFEAKEALLKITEPGLASLVRLAHQSLDGIENLTTTETAVRREVARRWDIQQAAEYELLQISYQIDDLFPRFIRSIN